MKTIGVLTSGGDAPGMNAAIRAVVRTGVSLGMNVKGIMRGYNGLIEGDIIDMDVRSVSDIIHRGGTLLYTARSPKFKTEEGMRAAIETCKKHGIEGIVVIGGDGSYRGARDLSERGVLCVGVPGTIDNDISSTDYTIGYDTAMNTGIAVGATDILIPEVTPDVDKTIEKIEEARKTGKQHFIIVVAEGVDKQTGGVFEIAKNIEENTGIETRATVLGHVQRGGSPSLRDRVRATVMGNAAVHLLNKGIGNRVVCYKGGDIVDYDIFEALQMKKSLDPELLRIASETSI